MKHNGSLILAVPQKSCLGETSSYIPQKFRFTILLPRQRSHHCFFFWRNEAKWRLRNERRNFILMTRHYPGLGRASDWLKQVSQAVRPIGSTTQIWVVTGHQYWISALFSQTSFRGNQLRVATSLLFSKATIFWNPTRFWVILVRSPYYVWYVRRLAGGVQSLVNEFENVEISSLSYW